MKMISKFWAFEIDLTEWIGKLKKKCLCFYLFNILFIEKSFVRFSTKLIRFHFLRSTREIIPNDFIYLIEFQIGIHVIVVSISVNIKIIINVVSDFMILNHCWGRFVVETKEKKCISHWVNSVKFANFLFHFF